MIDRAKYPKKMRLSLTFPYVQIYFCLLYFLLDTYMSEPQPGKGDKFPDLNDSVAADASLPSTACLKYPLISAWVTWPLLGTALEQPSHSLPISPSARIPRRYITVFGGRHPFQFPEDPIR